MVSEKLYRNTLRGKQKELLQTNFDYDGFTIFALLYKSTNKMTTTRDLLAGSKPAIVSKPWKTLSPVLSFKVVFG